MRRLVSVGDGVSLCLDRGASRQNRQRERRKFGSIDEKKIVSSTWQNGFRRYTSKSQQEKSGSFFNDTAKRLTALCNKIAELVRVLSGLPCSPLPAVNEQGSRVGWSCQRSAPPIELLFGFSRLCPLPKLGFSADPSRTALRFNRGAARPRELPPKVGLAVPLSTLLVYHTILILSSNI